VLEISITPNRGDALSHLGIAREIAALLDLPLNPPAIKYAEKGLPVQEVTSVTVLDDLLCPRYAAMVLVDAVIKPSPLWMRLKLEAAGVRAINNVVDATNYVLLEMGQPLHAFDLDRLEENRIVVRQAREGEKFITLDTQERSLEGGMLLICDGAKPVALAGVMGGLNSEIYPETQRILIESAWFHPTSIRKTAKKLGMSTEASFRFERGIDPEGVSVALKRSAQLMAALSGGGILSGMVDEYPRPHQRPRVHLNLPKANAFLGIQLTQNEVENIFKRLRLEVTSQNGDNLEVLIPSWRPDLTRVFDLYEELARLSGYQNIPATYHSIGLSPNGLPSLPDLPRKMVRWLTASGFSQIITYSFIAPQAADRLRFPPEAEERRWVPLKNPLSEDQTVMRTTLLHGLLNTLALNLAFRQQTVSIFELGKIFFSRGEEDLPRENTRLSGLVFGEFQPGFWQDKGKGWDFFALKGVLANLLMSAGVEDCRFDSEMIPPYLKPGASARIHHGQGLLGFLGELHPQVLKAYDLIPPVLIFDLDFDELLALSGPLRQFSQLPRFPEVVRDLAVILHQRIPYGEIEAYLKGLNQPWIEKIALFDLYQGEPIPPDRKSLGLRITYRSPERTLRDEEVNELHQEITGKLLDHFQGALPLDSTHP
jgi:phenylalanyl-tRNA synthetase beta chain